MRKNNTSNRPSDASVSSLVSSALLSSATCFTNETHPVLSLANIVGCAFIDHRTEPRFTRRAKSLNRYLRIYNDDSILVFMDGERSVSFESSLNSENGGAHLSFVEKSWLSLASIDNDALNSETTTTTTATLVPSVIEVNLKNSLKSRPLIRSDSAHTFSSTNTTLKLSFGSLNDSFSTSSNTSSYQQHVSSISETENDKNHQINGNVSSSSTPSNSYSSTELLFARVDFNDERQRPITAKEREFSFSSNYHFKSKSNEVKNINK